MKPSKSGVPLFGLALIVIGSAILLGKLHILHISFHSIFWPLVMILGLVGAGRGFSRNRRGQIFWNTVLFLYALFFFLRTSEFVEVHSHIVIPATFLIVGIAFLMTFVNNVRDWFFLAAALIFGGIGGFFILADLDYVSYWDVGESLAVYWPVALILFGLVILFRRRSCSAPGPPAS